MSTPSSSESPAVKYLPFRKSHVAIINEVTVEALKESAHQLQKDREDIPFNTALNHIAKSLGFDAGFGGFRASGEKALVDFMSKHELRKRANLVAPCDGFACAVRLTHRQIGDRLFDPRNKIYRRIFTGYNIPWGVVNDRWFRHNPLFDQNTASLDFALSRSELERSRTSAPDKVPIILEAAIAALQSCIRAQANLIDDMLLDIEGHKFDASSVEPKLYWQPDADPKSRGRERENMCQAAGLFRQWMELTSEGWVDVLPFNHRLIFLRGKEGEYDFVFQGLRDQPFKHNPFSPYLRSGDIPKSNDTHHFDRWLYFHYEGHLESDLHQAEGHFYGSGGTTMSYPGERDILRRYLIATGAYHPPSKEEPCSEGYKTIRLCAKELNVSDLITICQFKKFVADEPGYLEHRAKHRDLDDWQSVNLCNCDDLPVAVTWYDANAYAAWISRKRSLPVRLMSEEEYTMLRSTVDDSGVAPMKEKMIPWTEWPELLEKDETQADTPSSIELDGLMIGLAAGIPCSMPRLTNRFRHESLMWRENQDGLRFLLSPFFGEWLDSEGAAANSAYGTSLCHGFFSPYRGKFAPKSTGKYKGMKVGFRLCYRNGPGESEQSKKAPA